MVAWRYDPREVIELTHAEDWVLLAYRLPRLPSTPRSAVWRKLKRLGVAQLGDGLVALPADARTREQLEWIAEEVTDHGGEATLWLGQPLGTGARSAIITRMAKAIDRDYDAVTAEATTSAELEPPARRRTLIRLRREMRRIQARDYFGSEHGETARQALELLAASQPSQAGSPTGQPA